MKVIVLGSGTSTGVPMVGCSCRGCLSPDSRDRRTRASLLIRHNDRNILIDTSTDLRTQALREGLDRIDAVLFTHAHADHINGIDDLRGFHFLHREVVPCFGSRTTLDILRRGFSYIFDDLPGSGYSPLLEPAEITGPFDLFGLSVIPIPLEHGRAAATGFRIGAFAYLTDCSRIPDSSLPLLQDLELLVIDGLRWSPHPFHFHIEAVIEATRPLRPARTVLTHLTHDVIHAESGALPTGYEFAYDGMAVELPAGEGGR